MTHAELVERAIRWLKGTARCTAVASELATATYEIPDAVGWNSMHSWLIECKTSRSDFKSDLKKHFRRFPGNGCGNYRYYMTEPGLLKPDEVPDGWGLLETHPKIVRRVIEARRFNDLKIAHLERPMLVSVIRRMMQPTENG